MTLTPDHTSETDNPDYLIYEPDDLMGAGYGSQRGKSLVGGLLLLIVLSAGTFAAAERLGAITELFDTGVAADEAEPLRCPKAIDESAEKEVTNRSILVLVDLPANDEYHSNQIARDLAPWIVTQLRVSSKLEVRYYGGEGQRIDPSSCLDGSTGYGSMRNNSIRQTRDDEELTEAIRRLLEAEVRAQEVRPRGGPIPLLKLAGNIGPDVVAIWSDYLANDESCLDALEMEASPELAEALIDRCRDSAIFDGLDEPTFIALLGAGESDRTIGLEDWSNDVRNALCKEIDGCPA